jgi:hypothetical protein
MPLCCCQKSCRKTVTVDSPKPVRKSYGKNGGSNHKLHPGKNKKCRNTNQQIQTQHTPNIEEK